MKCFYYNIIFEFNKIDYIAMISVDANKPNSTCLSVKKTLLHVFGQCALKFGFKQAHLTKKNTARSESLGYQHLHYNQVSSPSSNHLYFSSQHTKLHC